MHTVHPPLPPRSAPGNVKFALCLLAALALLGLFQFALHLA